MNDMSDTVQCERHAGSLVAGMTPTSVSIVMMISIYHCQHHELHCVLLCSIIVGNINNLSLRKYDINKNAQFYAAFE